MKRTDIIFLIVLLCGCEQQGLNQDEGGAEGNDPTRPEDEPCQYEDTALGPTDLTPWGTMVADDIAGLETPVPGTWTWGPTIDQLEIERADQQTPATATFVHDPTSIRYSEHVAGGYGVACHGPRVLVDGTLTITDEQDAVIISIPITAARDSTAGPIYGANPVISPVSDFSSEVHVLETFQIMRVVGFITWIDVGGLSILFNYNGQSMLDANTGGGVVSPVGEFM